MYILFIWRYAYFSLPKELTEVDNKVAAAKAKRRAKRKKEKRPSVKVDYAAASHEYENKLQYHYVGKFSVLCRNYNLGNLFYFSAENII